MIQVKLKDVDAAKRVLAALNYHKELRVIKQLYTWSCCLPYLLDKEDGGECGSFYRVQPYGECTTISQYLAFMARRCDLDDNAVVELCDRYTWAWEGSSIDLLDACPNSSVGAFNLYGCDITDAGSTECLARAINRSGILPMAILLALYSADSNLRNELCKTLSKVCWEDDSFRYKYFPYIYTGYGQEVINDLLNLIGLKSNTIASPSSFPVSNLVFTEYQLDGEYIQKYKDAFENYRKELGNVE